MVNCAGIVGPSNMTCEAVPTTEFDKVYEGIFVSFFFFLIIDYNSILVNVRGSFLMTKYSLLEMKKRGYGRILLVASIAGKEVMYFF